MDILSTREIATIFWLIIIGFFLILRPNIREIIASIVKIACSKKLLILFFILVIYSAIIAVLFSMTSVWQITYTKLIVVWTLFIGVPVTFKAITIPLDVNYYKELIFDCFSLTVILELIFSQFTFNLITEIIIIPIITVVFTAFIYLEKTGQEPELKAKVSSILSIILVIFLIFTFKVAIEKYPSLNMTEILVEFLIPIFYSILFMPLIYFFGLYGKYDMIFTQIKVINPSDEQIQKNYKKIIFKACGLSYAKLFNLEKICMRETYKTMSYKEFNNFILKIKNNSL